MDSVLIGQKFTQNMAAHKLLCQMCVLLLLASPICGKNPLVVGVGMADPHIHTFDGGDSLYLYATHDNLTWALANGTCCSGDWWIWETRDLISWRVAGSAPNFAWAPPNLATEMWATDAVKRADSAGTQHYYWYVSVGGREVSVYVSDTPYGPWHDPLGQPMLPESLGDKLGTCIRDPGVLVDGDSYYIVFGACSGPVQPDDSCYFLAQLNEDMITFQEPRHLSIQNALGPYGPGKADDKPFLHARKGIYYLSYGCFYALSQTGPYGPYIYQGPIISLALIAPDFLIGNLTQEPWYTREIYADRHGSFIEWHGQWYFFCNERSHSLARKAGQEGAFRDSIGAYVHYYTNGSIAPITINAQGVGGHEVFLGTVVQAEEYFKLFGAADKVELPESVGGGFAVHTRGPSSLQFHILPRQACTTIRVRAAALHSTVSSLADPAPILVIKKKGHVLTQCAFKIPDRHLHDAVCSPFVLPVSTVHVPIDFEFTHNFSMYLDAFIFE